MRKAFGLVLVAVLLVLAAPAAGAPVPKRDCASRGEGERPIPRLVAPGDLQVGPVAFHGLARVADPAVFERHRTGSGDRYSLKTPLKVRAGRVVTVSIAPFDRPEAGLTFVHDAPPSGVPAVKFFACRKSQRSFAYDGVVGPVTGFPGGFSLAGPACVNLSVRVRGHDFVYRRTESFGMGPVAGNCDKI